MYDTGLILFGVSSVVLIAVLILHYVKKQEIPRFDLILVVLSTVVIVSGAVSIYELDHYVAYASVLGSLILVLSSFYDFPKMITNIAMVLSLAGAIGIMLLIMV